MAGNKSQVADQNDPWKAFRNGLCWVYGVAGILTGCVVTALPTSWASERIAAVIVMLGAVALLPPVLRELRSHLFIARSKVAPVLFAFTVGALALAVSAAFAPSTEERVNLQHAAMAKAEALLAQGKPAGARLVLSRFVGRRKQDADLDALISRIDASRQAKAATAAPLPHPTTAPTADKIQDSAEAYAERLQVYWLPEVDAMPDAAPADEQELGKLLTQIDGMAINIEDGSRLSLKPTQSALRSRLVSTLSRKQIKLLPGLRRRYAEALDAKLFRHDIRVTAQGTSLKLTGGVFARNANVQDMQTELEPILARLRFRRIDYRWSPYLSEALVYELKSPSDAVVARWDGPGFGRPVA